MTTKGRSIRARNWAHTVALALEHLKPARVALQHLEPIACVRSVRPCISRGLAHGGDTALHNAVYKANEAIGVLLSG